MTGNTADNGKGGDIHSDTTFGSPTITIQNTCPSPYSSNTPTQGKTRMIRRRIASSIEPFINPKVTSYLPNPHLPSFLLSGDALTLRLRPFWQHHHRQPVQLLLLHAWSLPSWQLQPDHVLTHVCLLGLRRRDIQSYHRGHKQCDLRRLQRGPLFRPLLYILHILRRWKSPRRT